MPSPSSSPCPEWQYHHTMPQAAAQRNVPTPQEQILAIVNNHWQGNCVGVAAWLELADQLANGPLDVDVLAERTETHGPSLYRMLRALEIRDLYADVAARIRQHATERMPAPPCARLAMGLDSYLPVPDSFVEDGWSGLLLAVKNGKTGYDQVRGQSAWEFMQTNPEQHTNFNSAMRDLSAIMTPAVTGSTIGARFR